MQRFVSGMSLQTRLPLLMFGVLAMMLVIIFVVVSATLERTALDSARQRLTGATQQIATVSYASVAGRQARYVDVARSDAVQRALHGQPVTVAELRAALSKAATSLDSGMPVELWSADRRRLAVYGNDLLTSPSGASAQLQPGTAAPGWPRQALLNRSDSLRLSPMYIENGRTWIWFVQPVRENGRVIGYIRHQRHPSAGPTTLNIMRELTGTPVTLYYRNADSTVWITATGDPLTAQVRAGVPEARPREGDVIRDEEHIGSSDVVVGMETPVSAVLARPRRVISLMLLVSLGLIVVGAFASWAVARALTRPLRDVTDAAARLAGGAYDVRVPERGATEIRHLAETFNAMAADVESARTALDEQRRRAERASNAKSDFMTVMSHELRTPLNAIGGYVDLLRMELRGPLTEEQKRDLDRIKTSQQHLLGLISSVLDLARVEAGTLRYDITSVRLHPVLAELDTLIGPQASAKAVALRYQPCPEHVTVQADHEKVRQILLNILSNAIRHTPSGGVVSLSVEERADRVAIVVADTGPGIPPDKRDVIFEPFVQLDRSLRSQRDGLGLGLAISRDLARGMSGDVTVESTSAPGARFAVTLPCATTTPRRTLPPAMVEHATA